MTIPDPPRALETTRDYSNVVLSLQLLALYAEPSARLQLQLAAILKPPVPTFAAFVRALTRLRN